MPDFRQEQHPDGTPDDLGTLLESMRDVPDAAAHDIALTRAEAHLSRELELLELAVLAPDDESARELELRAYEAYCDGAAIIKEHGLEPWT
jgi:hypothetical protein